tara:strand:+ start:402 stop:722 length:321 start_codon:yes stop_codon:yes gene_type:complete
MILSIIGIVIGLVAIGLFIWLKNEQEMTADLTDGDVRSMENCYKALMKDFTNYQFDNERKIAELEKAIEIKDKNTDRQILKLTKELPNVIRNVVGHIEFAKPLDKK